MRLGARSVLSPGCSPLRDYTLTGGVGSGAASTLRFVKVLTIVGNRPQFIKAAPLSLALVNAGIEEVSIHSGQHYDAAMSEVFYEELGLCEPSHSLDLRTADVDVLESGISEVLQHERPDWLIVFGDTNTTLAGARAGVKTHVALAHIEAGLRSGDLSMPEERNRIEVDRVADLLFCPDERSRATLRAEGVAGTAAVVGDVMADAARLFVPLARERFPVPLTPRTYVVVTVHREANVDERRLSRIIEGLNSLTEPVVFPAHPRTSAALERFGLDVLPHISLAPPLGYLEFAALASQARVILTDSGGLQKEAYWYGVPCVTLRPSTEWVDTVRVGANVLVDDDPDAIAAAVATARIPSNPPVLYGDGHTSERVAQMLVGAIPRR
jgi:UDP-GlcNAc3NAcA epimerase